MVTGHNRTCRAHPQITSSALAHGRAVDPHGSTRWTKKLDNGLSRTNLARLLIASHESAQRIVENASTEFLGRSPDPSGTAH